jgi:hypothetical protein
VPHSDANSARFKFRLGFIPGSKHPIHNREKAFIWFRSYHSGKEYLFERFERNESGVMIPKVAIYDSDDFPMELLENLLETNHIIRLTIVEAT